MGIFASATKQEQRKEICNSCPSRNSGICLECGCMITIKVLAEVSKCPLNKW